LLAANGLAADTVLQIGQRLLIPPVSGVVVSTQPGDTLPAIAAQWKIDPNKLATINGLDGKTLGLLPGEALMLPDVQPPVQLYPADTAQPDASPQASPVTAAAAGTKPAAVPASPIAVAAPAVVTKAPPNTQAAVVRSGPNNFPWGQCTYWAAQSRPDIGSRVIGNAASWLYSARAAGLPTGTAPRAGAIVVYQPGAQGAAWTGHVAYVTSVAGDGVHFNISEMNFPIWGRVTTRASYTGAGVAFIY